MISPGRMNSINGDGRVECQCQTEKPKEQAEPHTCAPFQKPADRERDKKRPDEHDDRDRVTLSFGQQAKHQTLSISEERSFKQVLWRQTL
jgi:hypothetical protein